MDAFIDIMVGDVREQLALLPDNFVQTAVTSPPYWGLRDYGVEGQIGNEPTIDAFVSTMVDVFREVKRVLRPDGSLYLNLGDGYAANRGYQVPDNKHKDVGNSKGMRVPSGMKAKDLIGAPWLVAFALRADGWYLREDIVWHKPNPMPESVYDRCTRSHEFIFHLTKSAKYYYDIEAVKEPYADDSEQAYRAGKKYEGRAQKNYASAKAQDPSESKRRMMASIANGTGRNKRDVWIIPVQPYRGGHFATFPEAIPDVCIRATSSEAGQCATCGMPLKRCVEKEPIPAEITAAFNECRRVSAERTGRTDGLVSTGKPGQQFRRQVTTTSWGAQCACNAAVEPQIVLDPFMGSGRTGIVATRLGRSFIGIELNPDYAAQAQANIDGAQPLPIADKQAGHSRRHAGFNKRYHGSPDAA